MHSRTKIRQRRNKFAKRLAAGITITAIGLVILLLTILLYQGIAWINIGFITQFPSRFPQRAGIAAAIVGSIYLILLVAAIAIPIGICSSIYLEEYCPDSRIKRLIDINIANLAGVPSIVYGLLGLSLFVRIIGLNRSLLAGACTMSLLILPIIITASREALKFVPLEIKMAAYALGANRWQTILHHTLPYALPGIATGIILAISRAMGETAPLIMIGAFTFVAFFPESVNDAFTTLPIQIYNWTSRPQTEFHQLAAAAIIILMAILLGLNLIAILIRYHYQRRNH